jgi:KDO2-lipid IV(A) lauroyltransferase
MRESGETTKQTLIFHVYRAVAWLGEHLSERFGRRLFRFGGLLAHDLMPGVRRTVAFNQAQVLGRPPGDPLVRASTRQAFVLYARYWFDSFHVVGETDEAMIERFTTVDAHHLFDPLEAGTGVIVAMPHVGDWDAAGRWLLAEGHRCVSVAEQLEPRRLFELFVHHRSRLGMDILGLSSATVGRQLATALANNRVVSLVSDRDLTGRGVQVTMFGRGRKMPAGPALLSITTGAPMVPSAAYQTPEGWRLVFRPPLSVEPSGDRRKDVIALTEALAAEYERLISAAPSDWHVFQPGWPE